MEVFNQNMLNNLFYILVSIFVLYFLADHMKLYQKKKIYQRTAMVICFSIPSFLCMLFPILIEPNCIHDFRQIPFLIGTLYGGWAVGFPLLILLLAFRFAIYGFNLITVAVYVSMFIAAAMYSRKFRKMTRSHKLIMSTALIFLLAIWSTLIAVVIADFEITYTYVIHFIVIPPFALMLVVYIVETLKDAVIMRSKLMKVEKMEVVSQLAASISHEVRNPLTVVKGFVQLLNSKSVTGEMREQYVSLALSELDRATSIIDDYLTFAKPAPQKVEKIAVDEELKKVIEMMRPIANNHSVRINWTLTPAVIEGCSQHVKQIFLNFMKNSIEAMEDGGDLRIEMNNDKEKVEIFIQDTGVGMTEDQINRFGEPYFSTKEKGTGLGTMVALRLIQSMKGSLQIKSVPQKGTTLIVTFPLVETKTKMKHVS